MIDIVIAEDHALVREGLRTILEQDGQFRVVGEATNGLEAVALSESGIALILLLDLSLPRLHGLDVLTRLKGNKSTKVLIVSMHGDEPSVLEALKLGARGYVLKDSPASELRTAIHTVSTGGQYLSPSLEPLVRKAALDRARGFSQRESAGLTRRERIVLQSVASENTSKVVARQLGISVGTVAKHRSNLMKKLGARTQADLTLYAVRHKLIDGSS